MERLPGELSWNVLSRLAVKELLRCKCVCKSWFDIITNPHFINDHYVFYNNRVEKEEQEQRLFLIQRPNYNRRSKRHGFLNSDAIFRILSWNLNQAKDVVVVSSQQILNPNPYHIGGYKSDIMGPCNGIYYIESNPRLIMNPSLRQFMALPPNSSFTAPHGTYSNIDFPNFGFDPKTNDYKVVVLKDLWSKETGERKNGYWSVELYSLNSNSWKKLGGDDDDDLLLPLGFEMYFSSQYDTYVNNCCHWRGYDSQSAGRILEEEKDDDVEDVVLAFDMVGELFRKIKLPKLTPLSSFGESVAFPTKSLTVFRESATIGLIVYLGGGETGFCFQVWVMKDYWDEGSWFKQYNVGLRLGPIYMQLVGFYGANQFLWKEENGELMLYELHSEEEQHTKMNLYNFGWFDSIRAARYVESLVSIVRGNKSTKQ